MTGTRSFNQEVTNMKTVSVTRLLQHAAFWIFYTLLSTAYYTMGANYWLVLLYDFVFLPFPMLFTYSQLYLFIPKLLLKKKTLWYIVFSLVSGKIIVWLNFLFYNRFVATGVYKMPPERFWIDYPWAIHVESLKSIFSFLMICGIAVSIKLLKKWYVENERSEKMEKEKTMMELEMLKAQVHPHFLFNTLNNLYSLTLTRSDDAPIVVTHLSGLLRYMLYDCNEKEVPLNNEIAALKRYVELEKLRYGDRLDVSFSCSGETDHMMIAPLLLLPFAENCFKHGVSEQLEQCWINLHLHGANGAFTFNVSNSCSEETLTALAGGIGLPNIRKRLELIYAGKYTLGISRQDEMYAVKLTIQLSPQQKPAIHSEIPFTNSFSISAI